MLMEGNNIEACITRHLKTLKNNRECYSPKTVMYFKEHYTGTGKAIMYLA